MKHFYLFTLFFPITTLLHAQLDTTFKNTKVVTEAFEERQMADAKSYLLNSLMDEKQAFRVGFEGSSLPIVHNPLEIFTVTSANTLFLEYERQLKAGFSINARIHYNRAAFFSNSIIFPFKLNRHAIHNFGFYIEPRWYFTRQKQVIRKESGNNFSGFYLSLLAGTSYWKRPRPQYDFRKKQFIRGKYQYSTLNIGWQRRFKKQGFLHLQLGTGVQLNPQNIIEIITPNHAYELTPLSKRKWITKYKVGLGFIINNRKDAPTTKAIWTYHKADTDMWKIDLFGLLLGLSEEGIGTKINIGYEKRLGRSPFSIETNLFYKSRVPYYGERFHQIVISISPRLYYNLKSRVKKGKVANDLSAEYLAIRNQWHNFASNWSEKNYNLAVLWGIQRRVFEHMYINYELGYNLNSPSLTFLELISELKIGLAF